MAARHYLLFFITADVAFISPAHPPSLAVLPFSLARPLHLFGCLCCFPCISLSPHHSVLTLCPAFVTSLVSITTATSLSCVTIFNQKWKKQREYERESAWKVRLPRWCIRWAKTNNQSTKRQDRKQNNHETNSANQETKRRNTLVLTYKLEIVCEYVHVCKNVC